MFVREGSSGTRFDHGRLEIKTFPIYSQLHCSCIPGLGETSWGMANDGEWRTGQYLVEGVKAIKCFHPRMLTPLMARVNTN